MKNIKICSILGLSALLIFSACKKEEPIDDPNAGTEEVSPVLTLDPTTLTVSAEGGIVSVDYQVENPVDGSTVSVDLGDVTWITDVNVTDSAIKFTVETNSASDSRTATLTVSYPGAEVKSLTVVQEGCPVLTLDPATLTVSAEGGTVSVDYQVENPVESSTVSVDLGDVTWITDVNVTDSAIELTVEANSASDSRTATLTVSYPGAEDVNLTVVQEAVVVQYDHDYELKYFSGTFANYDPYGLFLIYLSDLGFVDGVAQEGGNYYNFYLVASGADGSSLPTGTYTYSSTLFADMVFYYLSYATVDSNGSYINRVYFDEGSIIVSADGDTYTIEGIATDKNGAVHHIYYKGFVTF